MDRNIHLIFYLLAFAKHDVPTAVKFPGIVPPPEKGAIPKSFFEILVRNP